MQQKQNYYKRGHVNDVLCVSDITGPLLILAAWESRLLYNCNEMPAFVFPPSYRMKLSVNIDMQYAYITRLLLQTRTRQWCDVYFRYDGTDALLMVVSWESSGFHNDHRPDNDLTWSVLVFALFYSIYLFKTGGHSFLFLKSLSISHH